MDQAEVFLSERLSSDIQVVGQPMAGVESAAIGILIGTGARNESAPLYGLSHFTEQMLFRGTEHYDARELSDRFDALGIDYDSTAGLEMTLLTAVLIGDHLPEAIELLMDVVRFATFPEDAIDSVRSLIQQEIRQREDRPAQKVLDTLRREFFKGTPLSNDVLGSEDSIGRIGRIELLGYWTDRYTANNMIVSIAGNFEWDASLEQLSRITADWPQGVGRLTVDRPQITAGVTVIEQDTAQENIGFAFPGVPASDPDYYAMQLTAQALGGSMNSRLFKEIREERGLAYAVQARADGLETCGLFRVYVGTTAERAHESVEVVLAELRKLEEGGITEEELGLAKTKLKSNLIMRSESTSARMAANLRSSWFEHRLRSLEELSVRIERVTRADVSNLLERLQISRSVAIVALGPRTEDELFGNVLTAS